MIDSGSAISRRQAIKTIAGIGTLGTTTNVFATPASGAENGSGWPMFGHDVAHTGHAPNTTGPVRDISRSWRFETAVGMTSSPAIVDGTVYIGSGDKFIYALSTTNGTKEWAYETGDRIVSSPAVVDGIVYIGSQDQTVYALSAADGTEKWTYETGGGIFSSPTVADGTVYIGSRDQAVYALSAADGTQQWIYDTNGEVWSSPAVVDGTVYIGSRDQTVYAISAADGTEQWTYTTGGWVESPPTIIDDTIYVGSLDEYLYALSARDGSVRWSTELPDVIASSPAVSNGRIFVGCRDAHVYALSETDGTEQWSYRTGGRVFSSPAIADGTVYVGSADNRLYALVAADGTEQWTYDTGDGVFSSPAVHDGMVYVGSNDANLYALDGITRPQSTHSPGPGDTSTNQFDSLGIILGMVGLGGGGAWLLHRQRGQSDGDGRGGGEAEDGSNGSARTGNGGNGPKAETDDDTPSDPTIAALTNQSRSRDHPTETFERMIPDEIPRAPELEIAYEELTDETPIGSGGNADVHRAMATTPEGEVPVAIKTPRLSGTLAADDVDQMLAEAETWDQLDDHDHIVGVIDYAGEPFPWIAMEYMDGGDLSQRTGELALNQATWTAIGVTEGVHHAHRRGVAHLDLKPENILFRTVEDYWDVPKVADWGLSKHLLGHSKTVEGFSPHYAAPEQFEGSYGPTDDITDVYQLGAVIYELYTGRVPFQGPPTKVMRAVLNEEPTPPSAITEVPPELDDILLTALAKERAQRYDSLVYLRDALQDWLLSNGH